MAGLFNFIWFIFFGWWQALAFLLLGWLFYITIIGIPIGSSLFQLAKLLAFPFGKALIRDNNRWGVAKTWHLILNILWFPFGLSLAITSFLACIPLFIGIITIPVAIIYFRVGKFAFSPFGLRVVSKEEAIAIRTAEIILQAQKSQGIPVNQVNSTPINTIQEDITTSATEDTMKDTIKEWKEALNELMQNASVFWEKLKKFVISQFTPERQKKIQDTLALCKKVIMEKYTIARKFQKERIGDKAFFGGIIAIATIIILTITAYSFFFEKTYFAGKDIIIRSNETYSLDWKKKPINGKVIFKKDGEVLLSYAKVINGSVDTTYENYLNGKPKSEIHITYDWNKDSKSEYKKQWYENGNMQLLIQGGKRTDWYENGVKSTEWEKYTGDFGIDLEDKTLFSTSLEKMGDRKEWNEQGKITKETLYHTKDKGADTIDYVYTSSGTLDTKTTNSSLGKIKETFYPSGSTKTKETSLRQSDGYGLLEADTQEWYENGAQKSIFDAKNGSGSTFYEDWKLQEHTETNKYVKVGYFPSGVLHYEYQGQIGKTYNEKKEVTENCKMSSVERKWSRQDCFLIFCKTVPTVDIIKAVQCFDQNEKLLYDAPSDNWKTIKTDISE